MIKHLALAALAALALSSIACSQTAPTTKQESVSMRKAFPPHEQLVGRWKFVYTPERRAAVEAELARTISDPSALAAAKREAEEEASVSEIEFTADFQYVSWIGGKEHFRAGPNQEPPPGLELALRDRDTLVMTDPRKGELVFVREK